MNYPNQEYLGYINNNSPHSKLWKNMLFAFLIGGAICTLGQAVGNGYRYFFKMDEEGVKTAVPITMIFLGALFTGLNLYHKLAKHAGAGTLVPITGFANAIVSPAIEFKREGYVLGVAAKMFTIAGPVLVYGINSSIVVGLLIYLLGLGV